jgi:hypothetical protein
MDLFDLVKDRSFRYRFLVFNSVATIESSHSFIILEFQLVSNDETQLIYKTNSSYLRTIYISI